MKQARHFLAWQNLQAAISPHAISILRGFQHWKTEKKNPNSMPESSTKWHLIGMVFIKKTGGLGRLQVFKVSSWNAFFFPRLLLFHSFTTVKSRLKLAVLIQKLGFLRDFSGKVILEKFNALQSVFLSPGKTQCCVASHWRSFHICFVQTCHSLHGAGDQAKWFLPLQQRYRATCMHGHAQQNALLGIKFTYVFQLDSLEYVESSELSFPVF